jgi:uncharacterized protein YecE (DUF72 family)
LVRCCFSSRISIATHFHPAWVNELKKITDKGVKTYAFFNNHYAGFAPGLIKQFDDLWNGV